MATFMGLPLEIRNMIYEYCLVKNSTLVPFTEYYPLLNQELAFRRDLPTVSLLLVNKTIEAEAAAILYGKNIWRVTANVTYNSPLAYTSAAPPSSQLWKRRGPLFRNVILVFDQRDVCSNEILTDTLATIYYRRFQHPDERRNQMHDQIESNMKFNWSLKFGFVCNMTNLRSLTLDVKWAFCHMGCCRTEALQWMLVIFRSRLSLSEHYMHMKPFLDQTLRVAVQGIWKDAEKEVFQGLGFPVGFVKEGISLDG